MERLRRRRSGSFTSNRMRTFERITLLTATAVYVGYMIQQALKTRAERVYRIAAGESPYERAHPKPRRVRP
jgi:hypothetical protein